MTGHVLVQWMFSLYIGLLYIHYFLSVCLLFILAFSSHCHFLKFQCNHFTFQNVFAPIIIHLFVVSCICLAEDKTKCGCLSVYHVLHVKERTYNLHDNIKGILALQMNSEDHGFTIVMTTWRPGVMHQMEFLLVLSFFFMSGLHHILGECFVLFWKIESKTFRLTCGIQ